MQNQDEITAKIFEKLSVLVSTTGDFTLTWEELLNELSDSNEETLLKALQRYVGLTKFSHNKFEPLKNANLFSLEEMVFEDSQLTSYYICYNDVEIVHITRDLQTTRAGELTGDLNFDGTAERYPRFKTFFRNTI